MINSNWCANTYELCDQTLRFAQNPQDLTHLERVEHFQCYGHPNLTHAKAYFKAKPGVRENDGNWIVRTIPLDEGAVEDCLNELSKDGWEIEQSIIFNKNDEQFVFLIGKKHT